MGIINQEKNLSEEIKNQKRFISRLIRSLNREQKKSEYEMKKNYLEIKKLQIVGKNEEAKSLAKATILYNKKISKLTLLSSELNTILINISSCLSFYELSNALINAKALFDNKIPIETIKRLKKIVCEETEKQYLIPGLIDEIISLVYGDLEKEINDNEINELINQLVSGSFKGFINPSNKDNELNKEFNKQLEKKEE